MIPASEVLIFNELNECRRALRDLQTIRALNFDEGKVFRFLFSSLKHIHTKIMCALVLGQKKTIPHK